MPNIFREGAFQLSKTIRAISTNLQVPVWYIKHSPNNIIPTEKEPLAKSNHRSLRLPAFYVQVHFIEDVPGTAIVGGKVHPHFAAVTIYHVARAFQSDAMKQKFLTGIGNIPNLFFETKEMEWEYLIAEALRDLWKMNGLIEPQSGSEREKRWAQLNKAMKLS
ncbi:hypothetical protein PENANT_c021G01284 [Penicillium antarcticum]|uniref:Tautomerase cis-CaaD-like domain-containing protein n=1 Tax=Penicillium antarcticum TaxID=416450 RepID=A0A1V6PZR8_9EURO|nr:uncharacterized protein N7508_010983 [Penicillium antarcticum]KAJ5296162.1 hypothetical protein N7508_010983 [Penicillium antarcticum]OQD82544.1 hypothetical protein PENANT_c021G01284 [Penicillium antarcticum]